MFNACEACMLTIMLASSRKMAARTSSHAQQVSNRVVRSALSYLAYFDALEGYLVGQGTELHGALDGGPSLVGQVILLLLFADDLVLVSQSECGPQSQLNVLRAFCENRGLTVNLAKTQSVVFNQRAHKTNLVFAGQAVEQADRYKYLGLVMHHNESFMCAVESCENRGLTVNLAKTRLCSIKEHTRPI